MAMLEELNVAFVQKLLVEEFPDSNITLRRVKKMLKLVYRFLKM